MNLTAGKLNSLRRMADANGIFKMVAVDQRPPITKPIAEKLGMATAPWEDVAHFKTMLVETLQDKSTAMLLDPYYALPACLDVLRPDRGLVITLEDSDFKERDGGRISGSIENWSVEKIKRIGGHAVKVLAWYRPDAAPGVLVAQQDYVKTVGEACARYDIPFLLELLVYPLKGDKDRTKDYAEMTGKRPEHVLESVAEFAAPDYGVDIFKLESPVSASLADGSAGVQSVFDEMGRLAGRPFVMLSAGAGKDEFFTVLEHAFAAGASGFLAGRSIWLEAFDNYPDWDTIENELKSGGVGYLAQISALADRKAVNWRDHECYEKRGRRKDPAGFPFPANYPGFDE